MPQSWTIHSKVGARKVLQKTWKRMPDWTQKGAQILSKSIKWKKDDAKWNAKGARCGLGAKNGSRRRRAVWDPAPWKCFWEPLGAHVSSKNPKNDIQKVIQEFETWSQMTWKRQNSEVPFLLEHQQKTMRTSIPDKWWKVIKIWCENEVNIWYGSKDVFREKGSLRKRCMYGTETRWILQ